MLLAMGRRNDLPRFFEKIDGKTSVPNVGIVFTGVVIVAITLIGSFEFVVRSATFTILLYYSITNLSAIRQPGKEQIFGKIIPYLGLIGCLLMSVSLPFNVIISGIGVLIAGFGLRFLQKRFNF